MPSLLAGWSSCGLAGEESSPIILQEIARREVALKSHRLAASVAGLLTLLIVSCDGHPPLDGTSVRDSAGFVIVDHGFVDPNSLPEWSLDPVPELRIGVLEGSEAHQFFGVTDATRRSDGSIAILDGSQTLRVFDRLGALLWAAGGEGDGPGEFRGAQMVTEIRGDSVLVWDRPARRLSLFTPEGFPVRTNTLPDFAAVDRAWGLAGPDRLLIEHWASTRAPLDGHDAVTHHLELFLVDLTGQITDRLGRWYYATEYQEVDSRGAFSPAIFTTPAVIAPAFDGFWYGDTENYELRRISAPDTPTRILRWQGPDRTITDSDVQALLQLWGSRPGGGPDLEQFLKEFGRTHPRAERFPAYEEILTDTAGRLWVRDFVREHIDDGFRRWTVFSPDGTQALGRLSHSGRFKPLDAGQDWMLGVETDSLDVERIVLYRIRTDSGVSADGGKEDVNRTQVGREPGG